LLVEETRTRHPRHLRKNASTAFFFLFFFYFLHLRKLLLLLLLRMMDEFWLLLLLLMMEDFLLLLTMMEDFWLLLLMLMMDVSWLDGLLWMMMMDVVWALGKWDGSVEPWKASGSNATRCWLVVVAGIINENYGDIPIDNVHISNMNVVNCCYCCWYYWWADNRQPVRRTSTQRAALPPMNHLVYSNKHYSIPDESNNSN
jgi:hypothetical protein